MCESRGTKSWPQEIHLHHTQSALSGWVQPPSGPVRPAQGQLRKHPKEGVTHASPLLASPSACGHKNTELGGPFKIFLCYLACQNHSFLCGPFSIEGEKILLAKEIMQCLHKTLKDASIPDNHHVIVYDPKC